MTYVTGDARCAARACAERRVDIHFSCITFAAQYAAVVETVIWHKWNFASVRKILFAYFSAHAIGTARVVGSFMVRRHVFVRRVSISICAFYEGACWRIRDKS